MKVCDDFNKIHIIWVTKDAFYLAVVVVLSATSLLKTLVTTESNATGHSVYFLFIYLFIIFWEPEHSYFSCIRLFSFTERLRNICNGMCLFFRTSAKDARTYQAWSSCIALQSENSTLKSASVKLKTAVNLVLMQELRWSFCWASKEPRPKPSLEFQESFPLPGSIISSLFFFDDIPPLLSSYLAILELVFAQLPIFRDSV